jgi:hypothetical protein
VLWSDGEPVADYIRLDGIEIDGIPVVGSRCLITGPINSKTGMPTNCRMTGNDVFEVIKWMPRPEMFCDDLMQAYPDLEIITIFEFL